jgi:hypothetical protein
MAIDYTKRPKSSPIDYNHPRRPSTVLVRNESGTVLLQRGQSVRIA